MKKVISLLLSVAIMLTMVVPVMAADVKPSEVNTSGTPKGYVTISIASTTIGQGFIEESVKVPFFEGDNYASLTDRFFKTHNRTYTNTGTVDSGFYLATVQDNFKDDASRAAAVNVPKYILDAMGKTNDEVKDSGSTGETELGEFDFNQTSGWMYCIAQQKIFPGVGVSDTRPVDGDVIRWQFTLYGLGADLGSSLMGGDAGGSQPILQLLDRDGLSAMIGAINSASNKSEILSQNGVQSAYNHAKDVMLDLKSYTQQDIDNAMNELNKKSHVGCTYIAEKGTVSTTLNGAKVIPGQNADLSSIKPQQPDTDNPIVAKAKAHLDSTLDFMVKTVSSPTFGTGGGEWTVMSLARAGYNVPQNYYPEYFARVEQIMKEKNGNLHRVKYTEYSRLMMALSALGIAPTNVGGYNILTKFADFNNVKKQGVNGPIWALIALDTNNYLIDSNALTAVTDATQKNSRTKMIQYILDKEISGGGFALQGTTPDPDMTAMSIQALTPYYNGNKLLRAEFTDETAYNSMLSNVKAFTDRGITVLSNLQREDGDYESWGSVNVESTAQVVVALTGLGIDPVKDSRFIKNGKSLIDGIMKYAVTGGGFKHIIAGEIDGMATDQATYALVAYDRFHAKKSSLYNMNDVTPWNGGVVIRPVSSKGVSIIMPTKIGGKAGTSFNVVVKVGSWTNDSLKMVDGVFTLPKQVEVTNITTGSQMSGGSLQYNLDNDGKLRFAYMNTNLGEVKLNATDFPAELMTISVRLKEDITDASSLTITTDEISLKTDSTTPSKNMDVSQGGSGIVEVIPPQIKDIVACARVLYTGDGHDLIPVGKKAIAVEFTNLKNTPKIMFGETELLYSPEMSTKKGIPTYVALVNSSVPLESLNISTQYTVTQNTNSNSIKFADTNSDTVVNAQDALDTLSAWLRKTSVTQDKQLMVMNVTSDSTINTSDVLAIMESYVNSAELQIISK